jgi:hypothetical protein
MPGIRRARSALLLAVALVFSSAGDAHAYLDPGVASMIAQFFVAAAVAVVLSVKRVLNATKKLFALCVLRQFRRAPAPEQSDRATAGQLPARTPRD